MRRYVTFEPARRSRQCHSHIWTAARSVRTRRFGSWLRFKAAKAARTHRPRRTPKNAAPVSSATNTTLGHDQPLTSTNRHVIDPLLHSIDYRARAILSQ